MELIATLIALIIVYIIFIASIVVVVRAFSQKLDEIIYALEKIKKVKK